MIASHQHSFSAFDLGAESGRAVLGQFDGERFRLWEVDRFSNGLVRLSDGLHWDVLRLWTGKEVLRARCAAPHEAKLLQIRKNTLVMYMERVTYYLLT
jgi:sugar (pentulose or hexulose) kinase